MSATTGCPIWARCTRIWWVRPLWGLQRDQGETTEAFHDFVKRHGIPCTVGGRADGHLLAASRMKADRLLDVVTVALGDAVDQCQIFLVDLAQLKLKGELAMGQLVLDHHQQARRVAVETMDDARPIGSRRG